MTATTTIPVTRHRATDQKADSIRKAVSRATSITTENALSRLATVDDAGIFHAFLSDPQIHAPIYTLPRPLTVEAVRTFIADHQKQRESGAGLLFLNFDDHGKIGGYTDICVWPEWAAGELGGAVHPDRQGQRRGIRGARLSFDWMFERLGLDLICETASLDNHRTAHLLDGLGFQRMGEILSHRDDGTTRPSLVWEVSRADWIRGRQE
ncbi:GNAT family N-acetyltransferase [Parasphingorhabdus sp.]|uniref:GNAT family N-acetyltransferase n=1 Tax=Parasphingorhabdus sp. TaxID=2709688 RepID=UPI003C73F82B